MLEDFRRSVEVGKGRLKRSIVLTEDNSYHDNGIFAFEAESIEETSIDNPKEPIIRSAKPQKVSHNSKNVRHIILNTGRIAFGTTDLIRPIYKQENPNISQCANAKDKNNNIHSTNKVLPKEMAKLSIASVPGQSSSSKAPMTGESPFNNIFFLLLTSQSIFLLVL